MNSGRIGWILLHPATFLFASTAVLVIAGNILWQKNRERLTPAAGLLQPAQIAVNPPGTWLEESLPEQISRQIVSLNLTLNHPATAARIAESVGAVPAIESVKRVSKASGRIAVEANWRRPVAVVPMAAGHFRLVDHEGVLLDRKLESPAEADRFLRLSMVNPCNEYLVDWQVWKDYRVVATAAIAAEIEPAWRELELYRVVTFRLPEAMAPLDGSFELWTARGAKVIWSDTGATTDRDLIDRRIGAIRAWIRANGPLDGLLAKRMMLDVRTGTAKLIPETRSADLSAASGMDLF